MLSITYKQIYNDSIFVSNIPNDNRKNNLPLFWIRIQYRPPPISNDAQEGQQWGAERIKYGQCGKTFVWIENETIKVTAGSLWRQQREIFSTNRGRGVR